MYFTFITDNSDLFWDLFKTVANKISYYLKTIVQFINQVKIMI